MPRLLSNSEAAEYLGLSPGTLPRWRWLGHGPAFIKIGRSIKYHEEDLKAYLEGRRVETRDQAAV